MIEQRSLQGSLVDLIREPQEVQILGIFDQLSCQIGLRSRQCLLEVGKSPSLSLVEPRFDLVDEDGARPAVLNRLLDVPEPLLRVFYLLDECDVVAPGDFCHSLWQKLAREICHRLWQTCFRHWIRKIERPHPPQVAR